MHSPTSPTDLQEWVRVYGPRCYDLARSVTHDGDEAILTPYDDCLLMMPNFKSGRNMRKLRLCRRMR